ncbi:hypothetical protein RvY_12817 [Ramazzottius varieornatus]|uniref:Uncharacterized protein n=1 Tax=Ramazzottius varieornatus TaxID=947166 RepID=A0A1D1VPW7_RAMVA|nr:hypothetical protein RvY_12817 [Ramazzottius varieornatus]
MAPNVGGINLRSLTGTSCCRIRNIFVRVLISDQTSFGTGSAASSELPFLRHASLGTGPMTLALASFKGRADVGRVSLHIFRQLLPVFHFNSIELSCFCMVHKQASSKDHRNQAHRQGHGCRHSVRGAR